MLVPRMRVLPDADPGDPGERLRLSWVTLLFGLAAAAGLASPWLLGRMVNAVVEGTTVEEVTRLALAMLGFLVAQTILLAVAHRRAIVLGEDVLARLREGFVDVVTQLPLSTVERAGTGDLVTRTTTDIDAVANAVRYAVPQILVASATAGKSTIARLLAGIHPPDRGRATIGGVPLVDRPLEDLRREVALVTQEHHVFVGTVADNVRLGNEGASDADVEAALDTVGAGGWVRELADGLGTAVGSGGHALAPAQAQELALARLILHDPHTLVLDEATALLDSGAARRLERSLAAVLNGRTVVAIAHRLHTAQDADRIAVVEAR